MQYKAGDQTLYAKYVRGAKAGGVDFVYGGSPSGGATVTGAQFRPEKVNSIEAGIKGVAASRRIDYTLTAFQTTFTDLQTSVFLGSALFVANAGGARSRGVEISLNYRPVDGLRLNASGSFVDARFKTYPNVPCTVAQTLAKPVGCLQDLSGARTPFNSKWSGSFGVSYDQALTSRYTLTFGGSVVARSSFHTSTIDDPLGDQKGFALLDTSVALRSNDSFWTISLFGRNLTDVKFKEYSVGAPATPGGFLTYLARGRQIGLRLDGSF